MLPISGECGDGRALGIWRAEACGTGADLLANLLCEQFVTWGNIAEGRGASPTDGILVPTIVLKIYVGPRLGIDEGSEVLATEYIGLLWLEVLPSREGGKESEEPHQGEWEPGAEARGRFGYEAEAGRLEDAKGLSD